MSAPTSHDPLVVNTADGTVWTRREAVRDGLALYAPEKCAGCPEFVMATYAELEGHGIAGSADALPVPVLPEPQAPSGGFPLALPWAALMDDEDLHEFLGDFGSAVLDYYRSEPSVSDREVLACIERVCADWRLVAEAQHGHNTAPGPDAVTVQSVEPPLKGRARLDASAAVAAEATHWKRLGIEDPHDSPLHHDYRLGRDLPETGGLQ